MKRKERACLSLSSKCLKMFNICKHLFPTSKCFFSWGNSGVDWKYFSHHSELNAHKQSRLHLDLCPEPGHVMVQTMPPVLTEGIEAITRGRESLFFQEIHTWNYCPLPDQSQEEINNNWKLPCAISAGHCSLNVCTLKKDSSESA